MRRLHLQAKVGPVAVLGLMCVASTCAQAPVRINLLPNPSFEVIGQDGMPLSWMFHDNGAGATAVVDDAVAHSGRRSVKLMNPHPLEPHVFGTLVARVRVNPNQTYTLSLHARSANPGAAWFGCGPKWERRVSITPTGDQWRRFTLTFTTYSNEEWLEVRVNVDSETEGVWVDSIQLEEGAEASEFKMPVMPQKGRAVLEVRPLLVNDNLLANGSFEELGERWPNGWRWDPRNTDATAALDDTKAHSGRRSIKITNSTPFGPHVYGQLLYAEPVKVKPETKYTISAYVLVESPGIAWVGGAAGWRVRAYFPRTPTDNKWVRVQKTFTTNPDESEIRVMVITESPTEGIWVDDVKLEEGEKPTPFVPTEPLPKPVIEMGLSGRTRLGTGANAWMPDRYPPGEFVFGNELWASGHVLGAPGKSLTVRLFSGRDLLDEVSAVLPDTPCAGFEFIKDFSDVGAGNVRLETRIGPDEATSRALRFISEKDIRNRAEALRPMVERLREKVEQLGERGAYPRVSLTVAENFLRFVADDLAHDEFARAWAQLEAVEEIVRRALNTEKWADAPRYITSPVEIRGPAFVADMRWPDGRQERRPVIFVGMGPFGQARRDVDIFPDYGFNIMQVEFGPNSVLPNETEYSDKAINEFRSLCDRAAKAGVQVNLLISPHYFPDWAMRKWPHLAECSGGFFQYCVHAPEARQVIEKFLRYTIPKIKDSPALHSICLSNEPVSTNTQNCRFVRDNWHAWLKSKYATPERLNEAWGTNFLNFDEVPVPPTGFRPEPAVYDFVRYNQEEFAAFHRFMADIIHELAPDLPVHAKMMICAVFAPHPHGPWSIAPELFSPFCAINGNDAWRVFSPAGEWATSWQDEIMGYELQRCAREAPVFNSEDHIIPDRNVEWQSPTYIYNVYWQGAVHGRGASSAWVWERTYDPSSDFCGSILHRPECVEAVGHCTLDLNRLGAEVTALQKVKPRVAVVYALSGYVWNPRYDDVMEAAWRACTFAGYKTGFVYERQLEALGEGGKLDGYLSECRVIIVAGLPNLSAKAIAGLRHFAASGGTLIAVGPPPSRDEYNRPLSEPLSVWLTVEPTSDQQLLVEMRDALIQAGVTPPAQLVDEKNQPVYGVEYFASPWKGGWLINVSNYRHAEPTVRLRVGDRSAASAVDLISNRTITFPATIPSLQPLLLQVK